jgi:hypothetical protein
MVAPVGLPPKLAGGATLAVFIANRRVTHLFFAKDQRASNEAA